MSASIVLWVYAGFLLAGGVMGFVKAGSRASLIASTVCAVPIVLAAIGRLPAVVAAGVIGLLLVMFAVRYSRSRKSMPALPLSGLSALALVLLGTVAK